MTTTAARDILTADPRRERGMTLMRPVPTAQVTWGDALRLAPMLERGSVDCIVTSPPYWRMRQYGDALDQLGGPDQSLDDYVRDLVRIFGAIAPALSDHAAVWLNMADRYAQGGFGTPGPGLGPRPAWEGMVGSSHAQKAPPGYDDRDLVPVGDLVAAALRRELGWVRRAEIVWSKSTAIEARRAGRPSRSHEKVYLLTPRPPCRVQDPGESWWHRSVWQIHPSSSVRAGHPAPMPAELARRCLVASDRSRLALDPFAGSGTTLIVARQLGLASIGFESNADYVALAEDRIRHAPVTVSRVCPNPSCGEPIDDRSNRRTCGRGKCRMWRKRRSDNADRGEVA